MFMLTLNRPRVNALQDLAGSGRGCRSSWSGRPDAQQFLHLRMSEPDSSKWVAKQWRRVWQPTGLAIPTAQGDCLDGPLERRLVEVVTPRLPGQRFDAQA